MRSISSGAKSSSREGSGALEMPGVSGSLDTRMPSTMSSGALSAAMLAGPRLRTRAPSAVAPPDRSTSSPATRPCRSAEKVGLPPPSIVPTETPRLFRGALVSRDVGTFCPVEALSGEACAPARASRARGRIITSAITLSLSATSRLELDGSMERTEENEDAKLMFLSVLVHNDSLCPVDLPRLDDGRLFGPQCLRRIDARRAPSRNPARQDSDCHQHQRRGAQRYGIARGHAEQERAKEARDERKQYQTAGDAIGGEHQSLAGHHRRDRSGLRAQRNANAQLLGAETHEIRHHAVQSEGTEQQRDHASRTEDERHE